jgi:3',5'-cyclic AMP phosphodiesterase CpdA
MPLPARITELQDHAVGALVRTVKGTTNGMPAVRWLSVRQLRRTAADVVQASVFARFADKREAMAASPREFYRLPAPEAADRDVWVDFVADTGDGFDATFATACCLAGVPGLEVAAGSDDPAPAPFPGRLAQADLLVLGGDEVYPVASAPAYEERLNEVLRAATRLARVRHSPPVVALPGNHDWYDGLAAFRRNFCESWVSRGHDHDA